MSARVIGPHMTMGPVPIASATSVARGDVVRVVDGLVVPVVNATEAGIAVAMQSHPDPDFEEGSPGAIDLVKMGEFQEVELPFTGDEIEEEDIGVAYNILAAGGGTVNLALTAAAAFKIVRLGRDTVMGDETGFVVGVFLDEVTF